MAFKGNTRYQVFCCHCFSENKTIFFLVLWNQKCITTLEATLNQRNNKYLLLSPHWRQLSIHIMAFDRMWHAITFARHHYKSFLETMFKIKGISICKPSVSHSVDNGKTTQAFSAQFLLTFHLLSQRKGLFGRNLVYCFTGYLKNTTLQKAHLTTQQI